MLSTYPEKQYAVHCIKLGAVGYLNNAHFDDVIGAVRKVAAGKSVDEIGAHLGLASNTVSTYRQRILEKTGAKNDVELALHAEWHLRPLVAS